MDVSVDVFARCYDLKPHEYLLLEKKWQTVDYSRYQVLQHSTTIAVCKFCGKVVDPFTPKESQ